MRIITNSPTTLQFDVVRVSYTFSGVPPGSLRWGIWGYCYDNTGSNQFSCVHLGLGYDVDTRGLVVHVLGAC